MEEEQRKDWGGWCGACWSDWRRSDKLDVIGWAMFFVWAGVVLLAVTADLGAKYSWWNGWAVFFTGIGVIVLIGTVLRLLIPEYKRSILPGLLFGLFMLLIGLDGLIGLSLFWPLALITIGAAILLRVFFPKR